MSSKISKEAQATPKPTPATKGLVNPKTGRKYPYISTIYYTNT